MEFWECEECGADCKEGEAYCEVCETYLNALVWLEEEDDGQPDEAQEWYDFDPDC